jgi:hypothetical protein
VDGEGSHYNIRPQAQLGPQTADPVMRSSNSCVFMVLNLLRLPRSVPPKI